MYPCPEFSLDHHCVDETQNFSRSCIQSNNQFHHLCIGACRIHQCSARVTRNIQDNMGMTMGHADGVADALLWVLSPKPQPSQWLRVTIIMIVSRVHTVHTHAETEVETGVLLTSYTQTKRAYPRGNSEGQVLLLLLRQRRSSIRSRCR